MNKLMITGALLIAIAGFLAVNRANLASDTEINGHMTTTVRKKSKENAYLVHSGMLASVGFGVAIYGFVNSKHDK